MNQDELSQDSVADLVQRAAEQTSELVRQEIRLAQAEVRGKARHAGIGFGMFGAAGLLAFYGVGALIAAAILLLALAVEPWIAAVIVGVVLLAVAGGLALTGKQQVDEALPPTPTHATESVREDVDYLKERTTR